MCPHKAEHHLSELQQWAWAAAIRSDPRDGHETLTLLPLPPRILCASTGHYSHTPPHPHSWEPVQHATARVLRSRDNIPRRTHGTPQAVVMSRWPLPPQAHPAFQLWLRYPSISPAWVSKTALISRCFNPLLSGWGRDAWGPTHRGGVKTKAEPQELCEQRKEREITPSTIRSSGLKTDNQLDKPCICGIPE